MEAKQKKNSRIAWICLIAAGLIEIVWAYFMKLSDGFKNKKYTILTVLITALGIFLLSTAENTAPRDRICSLDRTWHRVHRAVRDNRVRRKPRQKEDAVHDHGRGRGNRAEALFIERIEAAFALGERLLVK